MNLTRQMQGIADLYNQIKPIEEKTYTPAPTTKNLYSSASDKNSNMLNEMYLDILNKSTTKQDVLNEAAIQPGVDPKKADINKNKKLEDWEIARANKAFGKKEGEEDEVEYQEQTEGRSDSDDMPAVRANIQGIGGKKDNLTTEAQKSYSAKKAREGKDIGKPGKQFKKIVKGAAKKYGSKKAGAKVAGAVLAKLRKEKFEQFGKTKHLMTGLNYKLQNSKNYKPAGSGKNTAVKKAVGKVAADTFLKATENPKKPAFISNSGPDTEGAKTLQTPIEPGPKNKDNYYNVNKFSQGVKKISEQRINNDMKNDKSIFDKLYEDVMADDDAIALGATDAGLEDAGLGGEDMGSDEVTLTIPRDVAQHLHSLLSDILGGAEDMEAGELEAENELGADEDLGEEDEQAIGDDEPMGEEIEAEEIGHPLVNQKKGLQWTDPKGKANVVDSTVSKLGKPGKGGDGKVTDKVGLDGEEGHPLVNMKKGTELSNTKGKSNVVKSTTSSKVGDTFFQPA